ncbi:hypothetical protein [Brevundimonas sp. FT23028]|uniref:hypothetical protein n=1 Tax=Brevundimonas sp. FT23028 TaxID=3393748 RepID=UPI003B589BEB
MSDEADDLKLANPLAGKNADEVVEFFTQPVRRGEFYQFMTRLVVLEASFGNAIAELIAGNNQAALESLRDAYAQLQGMQNAIPRMDPEAEAEMRAALEESE